MKLILGKIHRYDAQNLPVLDLSSAYLLYLGVSEATLIEIHRSGETVVWTSFFVSLI